MESEVDLYLEERYLDPNDAALQHALESAAAAGLPEIQVSACQGALLGLLAQTAGARRIVEIGTLAGYSTIWMARALAPDGRMATLEIDPRHAEVARKSLAFAGLRDRVEVKVGPAKESLQTLVPEWRGTVDMTFIDADKESTPAYFAAAVELARPGGLIVVDNVVRKGKILNAASTDASVVGIRRFHDAVRAERRVRGTAIQTTGVKGWDGLAILRVVA